MSGNAKNGKNTGIKCGFLNLQPESIMDELISKIVLRQIQLNLMRLFQQVEMALMQASFHL